MEKLLPRGETLGSRVWEIEAGSKRLTLEVLSWSRASARLDTVEGKGRVFGETTAVFYKAKELLENEAEKRHSEIFFEIKTRCPRMTWWVENTGKELFKWTSLYRSVDDETQVKAEARIGNGLTDKRSEEIIGG